MRVELTIARQVHTHSHSCSYKMFELTRGVVQYVHAVCSIKFFFFVPPYNMHVSEHEAGIVHAYKSRTLQHAWVAWRLGLFNVMEGACTQEGWLGHGACGCTCCGCNPIHTCVCHSAACKMLAGCVVVHVK